MRRFHVTVIGVVILVMILASACRSKTPQVNISSKPPAETAAVSEPSEKEFEDFDPNNFDHPNNIDNEWFPLKPGTQFVLEGYTEEEGERIAHRVISTVTDLTKVIAGVRTVVVWERDYSFDQLEEAELAFFAQDKDGTVWHLGQYPEVYEDGKLVETPAWIHGLEDASAGISMHGEPRPGTPSYSQGWGPAVNWTDRAMVADIGLQTCVILDCFQEVLVTQEFSKDEPNAFQLKYYARGVGNVRVGWKGEDATKETLELVSFVQLSPETLAEARAAALELEKSAYEHSKEVYGKTTPVEYVPAGD